MAAEEARIKAGLKTAEDELNLIKNQVQQTLLDIREYILDASNPFNSIDNALTDEDEIEFGNDLASGASGAAGAAGAAGADTDGDPDDDESSSEDDESLEDLNDDVAESEIDDDLGDEIVEDYPDDSYSDDEIIDDGRSNYGMMPSYSDPREYFEEEEAPEPVDEGFAVDEEPEAETTEESAKDDAQQAGAEASSPASPNALAADFDVLTMAGLVRWVAVTTDRLGANRTDIMLDAFEAAGRITPATRSVLHHLMALTEEDPGQAVPVREIVSAMVRMEGVMDSNTGSPSTRLLSLLMDVDDDPLDRLIA